MWPLAGPFTLLFCQLSSGALDPMLLEVPSSCHVCDHLGGFLCSLLKLPLFLLYLRKGNMSSHLSHKEKGTLSGNLPNHWDELMLS